MGFAVAKSRLVVILAYKFMLFCKGQDGKFC